VLQSASSSGSCAQGISAVREKNQFSLQLICCADAQNRAPKLSNIKYFFIIKLALLLCTNRFAQTSDYSVLHQATRKQMPVQPDV